MTCLLAGSVGNNLLWCLTWATVKQSIHTCVSTEEEKARCRAGKQASGSHSHPPMNGDKVQSLSTAHFLFTSFYDNLLCTLDCRLNCHDKRLSCSSNTSLVTSKQLTFCIPHTSQARATSCADDNEVVGAGVVVIYRTNYSLDEGQTITPEICPLDTAQVEVTRG
ncbi:hypothetical protein EGR_11125 [Echinococcus granulosus]|uniref:Uncharacterized protein n=1 Tax=Echinococcus granulosus TaxID=6210 RepID=W6U6R5_ECHGR|nr:hypothetical protein EGR_11125 [Echinococcus granulosus]EUB54017.1 hypothetical protein EGR_11125 [Echinococcus granulosus]